MPHDISGLTGLSGSGRRPTVRLEVHWREAKKLASILDQAAEAPVNKDNTYGYGLPPLVRCGTGDTIRGFVNSWNGVFPGFYDAGNDGQPVRRIDDG